VIGQRFGNYRALSLLGEGGMGAVYLAEHPDIGRRVAVKVLRSELIKDPQLLQRFLNEARAANAIRHPNIIEILDSGTTSDGTPYLVMELLEGEVLSGRIRRLGRLSVADALEFSYQAASALAAAHDKAIIHRDLKPDNLFIIRDPTDPSRERIKVLDFGIAKLQTIPNGAAMQTRTGTLMGTPVYMSPEQCLGTRTIDARSDIYAMGIIMFEMLSGRPPFLSEGFGELVNMHLNVRPPPLRDVNAGIPQPVEALVAKALEKAPDARHRSAAELQIDIRAAAGQSIVIRGTSSPDLISATMPGGLGTPGPANTGGVRAGRPVGTPGSTVAFPSSTTMTTGTGERYVRTVPVRRGAGRWVAAGLLGLAAAGVVAWKVLAPAPGESPAKPAAAGTLGRLGTPGSGSGPAPAEGKGRVVRLTVESAPAGASVQEVGSGRKLGMTPLTFEHPASLERMTVRVEKAGFAAATRELLPDHDRTEVVTLAALAEQPATPDQAVNDGPGKPARPEGGGQRDSKAGRPSRPKVPRPHHPARGEDEPAKL
jgi:eukaryotic-like serine/threonine-protein kinase